MKRTWVLYLYILTIPIGCQDDRLEIILAHSGANRPELEKVLAHYSHRPADSLKLRAARFLIGNMPAHYTYGGTFMEEYISRVHQQPQPSYPMKKLAMTVPFDNPDYRDRLVVREDLKEITADYLIHQIEAAFRQWYSLPWLRKVDFDTFCEYLLPYRMENEPLDYWRDSTDFYEKDLAEFQKYYDDFSDDIYSIRTKYYSFFPNITPTIPDEKLKNYHLECIPLSKLDLFVFRTLGLPSAIDYIPEFGNRSGRHYWATVIDPNLKPLKSYQTEIYGAAKIYRRTFSHNPTLKPIGREYVPLSFRDPFNKDVTDLYLKTRDITFTIAPDLHPHHAYLAVFNEMTWKPIAWGTVEKNKVTFSKMGKNILYLPIYYDEDGIMHPLGSPFILQNNGQIKTLAAQTDALQSLRLSRKYPYPYSFSYWTRSFINTHFEASDDKAFHRADTVYRITQQPGYRYENYPIDTTLRKQYWRFSSPRNQYNQLAELHFLDLAGKEITGKIIGHDTTYAHHLTDHDPLTVKSVYEWIGMDFGKPVRLSAIRLLARSDANGIYPGNEYELLYYCYPEGWISLGSQIATQSDVLFDGVPSNALYWLRNLTTGQEERPFTREKGRVRFW